MTMKSTREKSEALLRHERSIREAVKGFASMVDLDRREAMAGTASDTRKTIWEFAEVRKDVEEEIRALAAILDQNHGAPPSGFKESIIKISLAIYFLEKLEAMAAVAAESGNPTLNYLFRSTVGHMREVLSDFYMFTDFRESISKYLDCEGIFLSCAGACGVEALPLDDAVRRYKAEARSRIDSARRNGGAHV